MLTNVIQAICEGLGLVYYSGTINEFNAIADVHTAEMGMAIFFEGYLDEEPTADASGNFDESENITVWAALPSDLSDEAPERIARIAEGRKAIKRLFSRLINDDYEVTGLKIQGVKNFTDRGFDGVRATAKVKNGFPEVDPYC